MRLFLPAILLFCVLPSIHATTFPVGPSQTYTAPSAVAALVQDGDTVLIDAGTYTGDVAVWTKNNLLLRGVGGMAHLKANGASAQGKAIWVIQGANTTVEYIEFSGCSVPDDNGAGIRQEGEGLTVRNCYFHDNQEGILAGNSPNSDILIEYSHFARNGAGDGFSHNIYINHIRTFTLQYCYVHDTPVGNNVKSRANTNFIYYNRIMDEDDGTSSYLVDLPNGGRCFLLGNVMQQGEFATNSIAVAFGQEGLSNPQQAFFAVHNTIVNQKNSPNATFFKINENPDSVWLINNVLAGLGQFFDYTGFVVVEQNFLVSMGDLENPATFNYHLKPGCPAIDGGADPADVGNITLLPIYQYLHPSNREPRSIHGTTRDAGAFEYDPDTGVSEREPLPFKVYPNPSDGLFQVEFPDGTREIIDLRGQGPGVHYRIIEFGGKEYAVPFLLIK